LRVAAEKAILGNSKPPLQGERPKPRVNLVELMKDPDSLNIINEAPRQSAAPVLQPKQQPLQMQKPPLQPQSMNKGPTSNKPGYEGKSIEELEAILDGYKKPEESKAI
jgi:hypothetical protein